MYDERHMWVAFFGGGFWLMVIEGFAQPFGDKALSAVMLLWLGATIYSVFKLRS